MSGDLISMTKNNLADFFKEADGFSANTEISEVREQFHEIEQKDVSFYKINGITYDEKYPHREAFENIIAAMDNPNFNFVYILSGENASVSMYVGVVKKKEDSLSAAEYGEQLKKLFKGNFCGTEIVRMDADEVNKDILFSREKVKRIPYQRGGIILGIPSLNDAEKQTDFQGIDRLINSMSGEKWRIVAVCEPVAEKNVVDIKNGVYELYSAISVGAKASVQLSKNYSENVGSSETESENQSEATGTTVSDSNSKAEGVSKSRSWNDGKNSEGTNDSITKSHQESENHSQTTGTSQSQTTSKSNTAGESSTVSIEIANKKAQEAMKYIDEELLERLKLGSSKGLFRTSVFYMAKNEKECQRLKSSVLSLFQGDGSSYSPLCAYNAGMDADDVVKQISCGYTTLSVNRQCNPYISYLHSRDVRDNGCELATMLTPKEISLIAGLPMKEVAGLKLRQGVEFGLNPDIRGNDDGIELGAIIQRGQEIKDRTLSLSKKNLTRHIFIAGVTGSGKTTTCQKILLNSDMPWLVIEPAKTEYRGMIGMSDSLGRKYKKAVENIVVFTVGNERLVPFRFNPFELVEGENISSHIDMLKATFTTAFPMEASMPQILEEGIYRCYEKKGWNVTTGTNEYTDNPFDGKGEFFPVLSELLSAMEEVVKEKHFGAELQQNYVGSLISRLSNLTVGSKGAMFNSQISVNFDKLLDKKVIIEMEELKSQEDKALLMGFILTRLSVVMKKRYKNDKTFRHITLVEEAHRLLSKVEYGDSGSKKASVEMFTDMLAEVRKYGEGLIVVDQIPNKLATEVMKNTNTKIIHRIFARDDKETVGDTMMMDNEQKMYLSSLGIGEAIVFSDNTDKPVHIKVAPLTDTTDNEIDDDEIANQWNLVKDELGCVDTDSIFIPTHKLFQESLNMIKVIKMYNFQDSTWKNFLKKLNETAEKEKIAPSRLWARLAYTAWVKAGHSGEYDDAQFIKDSEEFFEKCLKNNDDSYCNEKILNYYASI